MKDFFRSAINGCTSMGKRKGKSNFEQIKQLSWYKALSGERGDAYEERADAYQRRWVDGNYVPAVPCGRVAILDATGNIVARMEVPSHERTWWAQASAVFPTLPGQDTLAVPESCVSKWTYGQLHFNACTYQATAEYLESIWGRKLHSTDREWLARHPLATDDGIAQAYAATALQGLVEPYGFGVARLRFRAGLLTAGAEQVKWMRALNCNPFALVDHRTTNAEAAERLGMTLAQVNAQFRLEYHPEPFQPSIIMERGYQSTTSITVGAGGGHARYLAPRESARDWVVSVQLAPLAECKYAAVPAPPPYVARTGPRTFHLHDLVGLDGVAFYTPSTTAAAVTPLDAKVGDALNDVLEDLVDCVVCQQAIPLEELSSQLLMCDECQQTQWIGYACPHCNAKCTPDVPDVMQTEPLEFVCQRCNQEFHLGKSDPEAKVFRVAAEGWDALWKDPKEPIPMQRWVPPASLLSGDDDYSFKD